MKNYWLQQHFTTQTIHIDWNTLLGDTGKEKFESLYLTVCKAIRGNVIWIHASANLDELFDSFLCGRYLRLPNGIKKYRFGQFTLGLDPEATTTNFCMLVYCKNAGPTMISLDNYHPSLLGPPRATDIALPTSSQHCR